MRTRLCSFASLLVVSLLACREDTPSSAARDGGEHGPGDGTVDAGHHPAHDAQVSTTDAQVSAFDGGPGSVLVREENGLRIATFKTSSFVIAPGEERYVCQNFANPFGQDVAIVKSSSSMTEGSHHMFAFQQPVTDGALEACSGLEFGPSAHSAQSPTRTVEYPAGIARALEASDGLRIQAHYLNVTDKPIIAQVTLVLHTSTASGFQLAASLFFNNLNISVAPRSTGYAEHTCMLPRDIELMHAVSHMHRFGTHFVARLADSTVLFETNDWAEPQARVFDPPLKLKAGTQITYRCDYDNTSDMPLAFGESAKTNEMCIFTGQFFPSPDGTGITCM